MFLHIFALKNRYWDFFKDREISNELTKIRPVHKQFLVPFALKSRCFACITTPSINKALKNLNVKYFFNEKITTAISCHPEIFRNAESVRALNS